MSLRLRDYQTQALEDIERRRLAGDTRVPIVLATGLGKTQIFTSYADRFLAAHPGKRVLIIAHTDELIEQAAKRARDVAPHRRVGIVKAERNEALAEIVVSSRQTLAVKRRRDQLKNVGLIVIDECHHAVRTNTYGKILEHFGCIGDEQRDNAPFVLGVTATLARADKAKLSSVWQSCTFSRDILFGIRNGYLLDVRGEQIIVPDLDMSRVRTRGGDYSEIDIADELTRTFAPETIAREYAVKALDDAGQLRRGIAFWPLVDTSYLGAKNFNAAGIRSEVVHGGLRKLERRELLQRFRLPLGHSEAIDVMHNAMVLTEGFDEPSADVVVIARPSKNPSLITQMVGRVLRPDLTKAPAERGKALILDVAGAMAHSNMLRALIDLSPEKQRAADEHPELSLAELDEWELEIEEELDAQRAGARFEFPDELHTGPVATIAFDPLGRDKVWGKTPAGNYFINAGSGYVFLCPSLAGDPGTYDVVLASPKPYNHDSNRDGAGVAFGIDTQRYALPAGAWQKGTEHVGLSLEMALSWGEDEAITLGGHGSKSLTSRKSSWRNGPPTEAQVRLAKSQGIDPECKTKGELSEELDARFAARRIDPLVALVSARARSTAGTEVND